MVYTITHLINSMVTQRLLPIGYSYGKRLHSSTEIKKISIFYQVSFYKKKQKNPHFIEIKIMPLYMSGEDLYFVKWPVVSVKLSMVLINCKKKPHEHSVTGPSKLNL
jgi:hypothetical protein